jgi:hypothetical protein
MLCPTHPTRLSWPPVTFLFSQLKIQLEGRHFYTIEGIKAEFQVVLNTLTPSTSKMQLKNYKITENGA